MTTRSLSVLSWFLLFGCGAGSGPGNDGGAGDLSVTSADGGLDAASGDAGAVDAAASGDAALPPLVEAYLKAATPTSNDSFGNNVAMTDDTLVVGVPYDDGPGDTMMDSGAAYVFVRSGTGWVQQAYLRAGNADAGDRFGTTVAISGDLIAVHAARESGVAGDPASNASIGSGAVYVFHRSGSTWTQEAYLKGSNTDSEDELGARLALDGDTLAAGSFLEDSDGVSPADNSRSASGAVYVFVRGAGGTWSEQALLKAPSPEAFDSFGFSVAVSGDTLAIGATGEDSGTGGAPTGNATLDSGGVYVFTRAAGAWTQQAFLTASNADQHDGFGCAVALSGETLLVGADRESASATGGPDDDSAMSAGAAYVFVRAGGAWSQQAYLKAEVAAVGDSFGFSVGLRGDRAVIGAYGEDAAGQGAGSAYVFSRSGVTWTRDRHLDASNAIHGPSFGIAVAISATAVAIGAPQDKSGAGGIDGDRLDTAAPGSGAVFVFSP